ncbi:thioredoxin TrxC [Polynucleobacter sp. MWH-UH23A]|uniref:thioredoxin TrxC n=1 Tax=Polynucleobacter sp. MWH-UH23A TaxID=1855613 RepID=UPI003364D2DC
MIVSCPHCSKGNRFPIEKIASAPTCGACKKDLLALPISPDELAFEELMKDSSLPVIVDFWAPWCGPCKMFAPTFEASAAARSNKIAHVKIDTEKYPAIGAKFNIRSIPTLALFKNGKEINRVSGALQSTQLNQFIDQAMG